MAHVKLILTLAIAAAIGALLCRPALAGGKPTGDDHLWLHVSGTTIRTSALANHPNSVFVPVGAAYVPGPGGLNSGDYKTYLRWLKAHGCNCFRLVIWTMTWDGHAPYRSDAEFRQKLNTFWDPIIRYAARAGLYVVIDDHGFMDPPPANITRAGGFLQTDPDGAGTEVAKRVYWTPDAVAVWQRRWGMIARKYAGDPSVMAYELMNEPHDWQYANGTPLNSVDVLRNNLIGAIRGVREYDKRHILLVPCNEWEHSRALEPTWGDYLEKRGSPDLRKNLIFAFHDYPYDNDAPRVNVNIASFMRKHHVPVLCTEFGTQFEAGNSKYSVEQNKDWQREFLADLSSLKVGWLVWCSGGLHWDYEDVWMPAAGRDASPLPLPKTPGKAQGGRSRQTGAMASPRPAKVIPTS